MTRRIKTLTAAILATAATAMAATPAADNATFGVQAGYASKNESAVAGLFFQYRLSPTLRIAPSLGCIMRHNDLDAFLLNVDMHFPLSLGASQVSLYPLAGINYSSWSRHGDLDGLDITGRLARFGVNLGCGFEFYATPTLKINAEAKYTLTSKYSTTIATVGIGYMF